jgi:hypothetical protein
MMPEMLYRQVRHFNREQEMVVDEANLCRADGRSCIESCNHSNKQHSNLATSTYTSHNTMELSVKLLMVGMLELVESIIDNVTIKLYSDQLQSVQETS